MTTPEDRDLFAAEYVLGTLDAAERDKATRLREDDPDFGQAVKDWEGRLSPLAGPVAQTAPSADVWRRVLAATRRASGEAARDNVVVLRRSVTRWRAATLATGALAAALVLFTFDRDLFRAGPGPSGQSYIAAVNRGGDLPALIVRVDLANHAVSVRPVEVTAPPGKSLELWYVAAGQAPKSMGVVAKERASMSMPSGMEMQGAAFAVSVEPIGGSPTGAPTGPVVYQGKLIAE